MWSAISDKRTGLSFTITPDPRQGSYFRVRVPRDSWPHFTVSDSRLLQFGGPGPRIYIPQEQGGPVIPPDTGFPFRRLLRLAGLRWRYSNPPPHRILIELPKELPFISWRGRETEHPLERFVCCILPTRCHGNACSPKPLPSNGIFRVVV
jgi:hypothetical protein